MQLYYLRLRGASAAGQAQRVADAGLHVDSSCLACLLSGLTGFGRLQTHRAGVAHGALIRGYRAPAIGTSGGVIFRRLPLVHVTRVLVVWTPRRACDDHRLVARAVFRAMTDDRFSTGFKSTGGRDLLRLPDGRRRFAPTACGWQGGPLLPRTPGRLATSTTGWGEGFVPPLQPPPAPPRYPPPLASAGLFPAYAHHPHPARLTDPAGWALGGCAVKCGGGPPDLR